MASRHSPLPIDVQPSQIPPNRNAGDAEPSANRKVRPHWSSVAHWQPWHAPLHSDTRDWYTSHLDAE